MPNVTRRVLAALVVLAIPAGLGACGTNDASQQQIEQAKRDAAQQQKIKDRQAALEQEVNELKKRSDSATPSESIASDQHPGTSSAWTGGGAYTAILASLSSKSQARQIQAQAVGRGLDAGVLFSSDYSSLRPGYWVVFSGEFASEAGAVARVTQATHAGYRDAYPRLVAR